MSKKNMIIYWALLCLFLGAFCFSLSAVMIPLSTERLTGASEVVLIGEVTGIDSRWDSEKTIIFTRATIYVYSVIIGDVGASTVDVEYEGGKVGGMSMGASDQPRMETGERVLLFLGSKRSFDHHYGRVYGVVGAAQGKYSIKENGIAEKGGFTVVEFSKDDAHELPIPHKIKSQRVEETIDNDIPVELLVDKIQGKRIITPGKSISSTASTISKPMYSYSAVWGVWPVGLKINTSGGPSYGLGAVLAGMSEWNNVYSSSFRWLHSGATTSKSTSKNGVNTVYFTNLSTYLGISRWWSSGGKIVETDVRLDSSPVSYYPWNFMRLKTVTMHELGHSLGLNHVSNSSIMKLPISDSRQRLFQDDIKAATTLYPGVNPQYDFDTGQAGYADIFLRHDQTGKLSVWLINGTAKKSGGSPGTLSLNWQIKGIADFDGDTNADIFLRDSETGKFSVWLIDGTSKKSGGSPGTVSLNWQVRGIGDFDNDGKADILLWDGQTGKFSVWLIDGTSKKSGGSPGTVSLNWQVIGIGDFDNDGKADILLWDGTTGKLSVWLIDGTSKKSGGSPGAVSLNWQVIGIGDFDNDGKADVFLRDAQTGKFSVWLIDGTSKKSSGSPGTVSLNWQVMGIADFDNDGKADIFLRDSQTGKLSVWLIDGTAKKLGGSPGTVSLTWKLRGIGDFDGDSKTDILFRNYQTGALSVWLLDGTSKKSGASPGTISDLNWKVQ